MSLKLGCEAFISHTFALLHYIFFYYLLKVDLQPFLKMKKHLKINCSPKAVSLLSKNEISDIGAKEKRTK